MALVLAHPMLAAAAGYYLLNAIAAGMPTPEPGSSLAYRWLNGSLHALAMNFAELARARFPQFPATSAAAPSAPERPPA